MEPYAFNTLIEALGGEQDLRTINMALRKFAAACGFEWFAYIDTAGADVQTLSNYPLEWQSHYLAKNYSLVDPVVIVGRNETVPFLWSREIVPINLSKEQKKFFGEAQDFGVRSGVSIPVFTGYGRTAVFTLATSNKDPNLPFIQDPAKATAVATYLHLYLQLVNSGALVGRKYQLTSRQINCLKWAANNKTHKEIGEILNIGESAVRKHLNKARDILGAGGIKNAIYIATKNFLI